MKIGSMGVVLLCFFGCGIADEIRNSIGPAQPESRGTDYLQSRNASPELIKGLLSGANLSEAEIEYLISCDSHNVRHLVARNTNVPLQYLEKLATDRHPLVRGGVASNFAITLKLVEQLQFDKSWHVRGYLAENPMVPEEILLDVYRRSRQKKPYVTWRIFGLSLSLPLDNHGQSDISLIAFGNNPNCPVLIRQAILKSNDPYLRRIEVRWNKQRFPEHMTLVNEYNSRIPKP